MASARGVDRALCQLLPPVRQLSLELGGTSENCPEAGNEKIALPPRSRASASALCFSPVPSTSPVQDHPLYFHAHSATA